MTEDIMCRIKEKLKTLPMSPGVYLMKDKDGKIIYVGKSKVLKSIILAVSRHTEIDIDLRA